MGAEIGAGAGVDAPDALRVTAVTVAPRATVRAAPMMMRFIVFDCSFLLWVQTLGRAWLTAVIWVVR